MKKIVQIRKELKDSQPCKYIVHYRLGDDTKWQFVGSYLDKSYAEAVVDGFTKGIQAVTTSHEEIEFSTGNEWKQYESTQQ